MNKENVDRVIEMVRQGLKAEGGDIEVISIRENIMYVRMLGACETCPMAGITMKNWVEKTILEALPELKGVKAV